MYQLDFERPIRVHFIGIGGISMSALAEILHGEGFAVSGSDSVESESTLRLEKMGIEIEIGQRAENLKREIDLVVYTAAVHEDNTEWMEAKAKNLPMLSRAELLGQLMRQYKTSVAVAGTHGKTTATSMIAHILLAAGKDPTICVGGMLDVIEGNVRAGGRGIFLTEACEYTGSFLNFYPRHAVILNVEEDHMDYFKTAEAVRECFHDFAQNVPEGGTLIVDGGIDKVDEICAGVRGRVVKYGISAGVGCGTGNAAAGEDYSARDISYDERGCASFGVFKEGEEIVRINLRIPGAHNVSNAMAAAVLAAEMGIEAEAVREGLSAFGGAHRRFEYKGRYRGAAVIDDYAHHPTEIRATLTTARLLPVKRVICVFQPHTYSRTRDFWDDFVRELAAADLTVLADVYAARERDKQGVRMENMAEAVRQRGTECRYFSKWEEIEEFLSKKISEGDLLIIMGAGDIYKIGEKLTKAQHLSTQSTG